MKEYILQGASPEFQKAYRYSNQIMAQVRINNMFSNHIGNWKTRIYMQLFFVKVKGGDTIKFKAPNRRSA
jgi:hypothetical protein